MLLHHVSRRPQTPAPPSTPQRPTARPRGLPTLHPQSWTPGHAMLSHLPSENRKERVRGPVPIPTPTHPKPLSCVPGRTETRTDPLLPRRGSPTCHGSSTDGLLPTEFLAGGTQASVPPQASPLPSGPPARAFLPPPVRSPRGHRREGLESQGSWAPFLSPLSPWKWGSLAKALVSGSWAFVVRLWLMGEPQSEARLRFLE